MTSYLNDLNDDTNSTDSSPRVYSVIEITRNIKASLESKFGKIWIEGEISNYQVASSGHAYFVLKDNLAQISCVLFRNQRKKLKFDPEDGEHVLLFGRVTVYETRGNYQVIAETLEPRGLGIFQKAFEQLKKKLSKEGLFETAIKKPLPSLPWKIGVITSPSGAAIRDIIEVISRRNIKISILLYPVKVQGEGASEEITKAIEDMNLQAEIDVLILGRGGGSIEDLWSFNEESVARAIHASKIPVVSAIGHEIDYTIADFVADVRAPTPSAAAEIVTPLFTNIEHNLQKRTKELIAITTETFNNHKERLEQLVNRRFFLDPMRIIHQPTQRLDELFQRLRRLISQGLSLKKDRLVRVRKGLIQTSPARIMPYLEKRIIEASNRLARALEQALRIEREHFKDLTYRMLKSSPSKILNRQRDRFRSTSRSLFRISPKEFLLNQEEKRLKLKNRLIRETCRLLGNQRDRIEGIVKNLDALSPLNILQRGYAIAKYEGKAIKISSKLKQGDKIQVRLHRGQLNCRVDKTLE